MSVNYQPFHITRWTALLKDALILNIIHNRFKRRGTEVLICTIVIPLKRANKTMIKLLSSHNFARLTRWVPLVEQELLTITEHLSSPPVFTWSLVLCICFVDRCLSICTFNQANNVAVWRSTIEHYSWFFQASRHRSCHMYNISSIKESKQNFEDTKGR
jgi:hypothetical protein